MAKAAGKPKSFTKAELVEQLAAKLGSSKSGAADALDATFEVVKAALKNRKTCSIPQFGTFNVQSLKKRKGRNPRTNEVIDIPASRTVRFKPSISLKKDFNK